MKNPKWKKSILIIAVAVCMIITAVFSVSAATTTDVNAGEITKISDGVISQEYSEIKSYRENNYTEPGTPSGYSNYVFAGWFTDAKCTTETTATSGAAHAKFVIEDVLSVKAQFLAGTSYATEKSDMRFVTTVDSLDYEEVGFKCEINGVTKTAKSDTVYKKLYASFRKGDGSTAISTLLPSAFSEATSKYFMACILKDIPNADFGDAIKITPYWITLDGTKVYGEPVVKTVNNGYVDIATGVTVQQNPVIDYSEDYKTYITDTTLTYWPQGGCIGVQDGKTYYYQAMVSTDESNSVSHILKIDMTTGKIEMCSGDLDLGHTNDITYNKDLDVLVVCQNNPNYQRISFVDPSTLKVVNPNNIGLEFGDGVDIESTYITTSHKETRSILSWTWTEKVKNNLFSLEYNSFQQKYVVGMSGGQTFRILNADFSDPNASRDAFSPTDNTSGFTTQNVVADDSYIYFILYHGGAVDNSSYEGHVIAVYDWNGNYVTVLEIPTSSIAKNVEPENMAIYDNQMYISCGNKEIYKVATFDISEAEFEAKIENYYSESEDTTGYFKTLEEAVEAVQDGQTIIITSPNVSVSENLNIDNANVTITNEAGMNVTVKKGADFSGNLISNNADGLKIQGADTGSLTFAGNGYSGSSLVAVNNKVTIEKVNFKNLEANYNGGAVNVRENASATIKKCKFDNNTAGEQGGAIYVSANATTRVEDSTFTGNKTINYSGGAIRSDGALTVTVSTFTKNESATVGGAVIGDGENSSLTLTDCQFESNTSNGNGGAVQASTGCVATLNVTENGTGTFLNNSANGAGGAIRTNNAALTVTGYQFLGNTSTGSGGAINIGGSNEYEGVSDQPICLEENTFVSNTAGGNGGAVYNATRTIEMTSCTFGQDVENKGTTTHLGNEAAGNGGAFYVGGGANATLTSVIFKNNTATGNGGAIYNAESSNTTLDGTGSFDNNKAKCEMSADNYGGGAICVGSGNLDVDGYSFTDNNVVGKTGGAIRLNSTATISTIKNCQFTSNKTTGITGDSYGGAAIYTHADKLTVEGSRFTSNTTGGNGGAICVISGGADLAITSCQFGDTGVGNSAYRGGAIFCGEGAKVTAQASANYQTGALFSNNSTTSRGGAIAVTNGSLTIQDYGFEGNTSAEGGAIHLATNTIPLSIEDSSFNSNQATSSSGGAIYSNSQKTITITDTTFNGNTAPKAYGGAIFHNNSATMNITGGSFISNTAYEQGGAFKLPSSAGTTTVTGVTFEGNTASAGSGGAIRCEATLEVKESTFTSNTSKTAGGAIVGDGTKSVVTITDCNFSTNSSGTNSGAVEVNNGATAILNVTEGNAGTFTGNSAGGIGGAIYTNKSTLTIKGYKFDGNTATNHGGAICINSGADSSSSTIQLESNTFVNNTSGGNGGAIYDTTRTVNVVSCVFGEKGKGNTAALTGGAVYCHGTSIAFADVTFTDNVAEGSGGAIFYTASGTASLSGTGSFSGNQAKGTLAEGNFGGGAICMETGNLTVDGYTFTGNSSANQAGGAIRLKSTATVSTIQNCQFSLNETTGITGNSYGGGAIMSSADTLTIEETTFTKNTTGGNGGAVCVDQKKLVVTSCQFGDTDAGNTAYRGGAIYCADSAKVTLKASNVYETDTIFKSNSASERGGAIAIGSGSLTVNDYAFEGNTSAEGGAIHLATSAIPLSIEDSSFSNNQATSSSGGAIYSNSTKTITITDTTFNGNGASKAYGGAILHNNTALMSITGGSFISNTCHDAGGAIKMSGAAGETTITGVTFTDNQTSAGSGGAIRNESDLIVTSSSFTSNMSGTAGGAIIGDGSGSTLNITNTQFTGNTAKGSGGAVQASGGCVAVLEVKDSGAQTFSNNSATTTGGAIQMNNSALTVKGYTFDGNSATSLGGAINIGSSNSYAGISDTNVCLEDNAFNNNTTSSNGAAVHNFGRKVDIKNGTFTNNTATGNGGAIYNGESGVINLTGVGSFSSNNAKCELSSNNYGGGAICIGSGQLHVDGYSFNGNSSANQAGGAIKLNSGSVVSTIKNSNFVSNQGTNGGAIMAIMKTLQVEGSTFKTNSAISSTNGGAIYAESGDLTVTSCQFGGDSASDGNSANYGGCIYAGSSADIILQASNTYSTVAIFKNNTSTGRGGAVSIGSGTLTISNYAFDSNTSAEGGAIHLATSSIPLQVQNSSFNGNQATGSTGGGAIFTNSQHTTTGIVVSETTFTSNKSPAGAGGAIGNGSNHTAPITVSGCTFTGNESKYSGGAIVLTKGDKLTVTDSTFKGNKSSNEYGGAILTYAKQAVITDCNFGGLNVADGNSAIRGGAIYGGSCTFTITSTKDAVFQNNTATERGGAMNVFASTLNIEGYQFVENKSSSTGGAIHVNGDSNVITIKESIFTSNTASANGGAIYNASTNTADGTTIEDCKFNSNQSASAGGALWSEKTKLVINRTDFVANKCTTSTSGAIKIGGASLTATDCNFVGNTAAGNGGVIEATGSNPTIVFTVSAGNEGKYGFYNNTSTSGGGGAIRANWITSMSIYGYVFEGNTCGGSGSAINTGDGCSAGLVTLEQCTLLSGADISSHYSGAVVQTNSLQ